MTAGPGRAVGAAAIVLAVVGLVVVTVSQAAPRSLLLPATAAEVAGDAPEGGQAPDTSANPAAESAGPHASPDWVAQVADRTGIPDRALAGYGSAALRLTAEQPSCGLGWTTLAAIGAVESVHGTHGGTHVGPDGRTITPIIGIALDGRDGVAAIADTDDGILDGDTRWDRAVGPMQFIPSTWERWAADGNGDGIADPHVIDDVALAAGRYLCAAGGDLSRGADWRRAVLTYNRSAEYAARVLDTANEYARASRG